MAPGGRRCVAGAVLLRCLMVLVAAFKATLLALELDSCFKRMFSRAPACSRTSGHAAAAAIYKLLLLPVHGIAVSDTFCMNSSIGSIVIAGIAQRHAMQHRRR